MSLCIYITKDFDQMSHVAADLAEERVKTVQASKAECVLGLATGSSPTGLYKHLAKAFNMGRLDPRRVRSFNLDEYVGLPGANAQQRALHNQSYSYFMVSEFFALMPVKFAETFVPCGLLVEQSLLQEALAAAPDQYDLRGNSHGKAVVIREGATGILNDIRLQILQGYHNEIIRAGGIDLQIIGVGGEGHVAFHESGIPFDGPQVLLVKLDENTIENAVADGHFNCREESPQYAVSMSAELVFEARSVILLANGSRKTQPMTDVLLGDVTPEVPASYGQRYGAEGGEMIYVLDEIAAAGILENPERLKAKGYELIDLRGEPYTRLTDIQFVRNARSGCLC